MENTTRQAWIKTTNRSGNLNILPNLRNPSKGVSRVRLRLPRKLKKSINKTLGSGEWIHQAMTWDGNGCLKIYINGIRQK